MHVWVTESQHKHVDNSGGGGSTGCGAHPAGQQDEAEAVQEAAVHYVAVYYVAVHDVAVHDVAVYEATGHSVAVYDVAVHDVGLFETAAHDVAVYDVAVREAAEHIASGQTVQFMRQQLRMQHCMQHYRVYPGAVVRCRIDVAAAQRTVHAVYEVHAVHMHVPPGG